MKIAIIGSRGYPYVYSGYETFVKELSERLVQRNIEVTVYCHRNLFHSYPKEVNGIKLVYIWTIERKTLSQFVHSFLSVLHACFHPYDIILVVNSANGPFGLLTKLFMKRTAINVDGLEWLRPKWKGLGSSYFYWASRTATYLYDVIITDSLEMQKVYQREFAADSEVIAYGANIRSSKNVNLIDKWGLRPNAYYLIVGRLIPDNNADIIVKEFIKSTSNKKLVIVGDIPYKDPYVQRIKSNDDPRLVFTGYVNDQDELAELYHHCYVYLHGHEFGGTNPTMLKALAYGCAVCALDTVFNREMLDHEAYGIFFTKAESNLRTRIEWLEKSDAAVQRLKSISRKRITVNYTWGKIVEQYEKLFEKMMS
jgi:glycosyltransferase involved in cell wall biosynthesis